jgi:DNA-binding CsgD family transcriptional regulator/PAS domain-containing protein
MIAMGPPVTSGTAPPSHASSAERRFDRDGDLPRMMDDLVDVLDGVGAALATYSADRRSPHLLYATGLGGAALDEVLSFHRPSHSAAMDAVSWERLDDGKCIVLQIVVARPLPDEELVASVVFDREDRPASPGEAARQAAMAIKYLRLWHRHAEAANRQIALQSALDLSETGIILIDAAARILFVNGAAEDLLQRGDGISRSHGMLRATNLTDAVNFQAALSHVSANPTTAGSISAPLLTFRRVSEVAIVASLLPARIGGPDDAYGAMVYLVDPTINNDQALSPLCRLYGLSPAETALACRLAAGDTLAAAAEKLHVKEQTARSYLKQIFLKTGVKRQTELIVMMLSRLMRIKRQVRHAVIRATDGDEAIARFTR